MAHLPYIVFVFAIGACVGSFLNVVVWRLPRIELPEQCGLVREWWLTVRGLSDPPSHCPKCGNKLKAYDNLPVVGWIKLGGRCRFCRQPISVRYPIVEAVTALIFVGYYLAYYVMGWRACCPQPPFVSPGWDLSTSGAIFALYLFALAGLLAVSLIDLELYSIPQSIPWLMAAVAVVIHAAADRPWVPASLNLVGEYGPRLCALSAGGTVGWLVSVTLWRLGVIPTAFPDGEPMLDVDREAIAAERAAAVAAGEPLPDEPLPPAMRFGQLAREIGKEVVFLVPPVALATASLAMAVKVPAVANAWASVAGVHWLTGLLGAMLGALVGAVVPWVARIVFTFVFRRVAMGLGDVHLMFGVGAVVGAGGATVAFFTAPAAGLAVWVVMFVLRRGRRELPFGPYLSLATAGVMLWYCPVAAYFGPALQGLVAAAAAWRR